VCHSHGVGANLSDRVARQILGELEAILRFAGLPKTLLVISADHGQIMDKPDGAIPINRLVPGLEGMLKRDSTGEPIYFSGGQRHLCLHPRLECEHALLHELKAKLNGAASVLTADEMFKVGMLGPNPPKASYLERLGSIAILPQPGYSVFWDKPQFANREPSHHGGVSPQEMETPLLLLPLG
jgi:hypothetical protein